MNFSEFAQLLYPYKSNGYTQVDFVIYLTNNIMSPIMSENGNREENEWGINPFENMQEDTLHKIYRGQRPISKTIASKILYHLSKSKFEMFIAETPFETLELIRFDLQKKEIDCTNEEVPQICTDIFVSILNDCANKKRKSSQKTSVVQALQIDGEATEVWSVWESEPASMPEDFYKCFNKYAIADFVKLDPMNLILEKYILAKKRPDREAMIKGAIQFVKDTEDAMQRAEISYWNEKVCKAISAFAKSLREYVDFLMENAERPDFTTSPFLLTPINIDEFKRKEIWHRKKLQSIYRQIADVESRWHGYGLQMYANFPGQ